MSGAVGVLVGEGVANCLKGQGKNSHVEVSRPTKEPSEHSRISSSVDPGAHKGASDGASVGQEGKSHVLKSRTKFVPSGHILISGGQRPGRRFRGPSVGSGVEVVGGLGASDTGEGNGIVGSGVGTGTCEDVGAGESPMTEFPPGGSVTTDGVGRGVDAIGTGEGFSVGICVGFTGAVLGVPNGCRLGDALGYWLGTAVGPMLGSKLGNTLGLLLGPSVGTEVGIPLGKKLGVALGLKLGEVLGVGLGR